MRHPTDRTLLFFSPNSPKKHAHKILVPRASPLKSGRGSGTRLVMHRRIPFDWGFEGKKSHCICLRTLRVSVIFFYLTKYSKQPKIVNKTTLLHA